MFETTPPGFTTSTRKFAGVLITLAGTCAISCVALTRLVGSTTLAIRRVAPERNPLPLIVSVNPAAPAVAELGFKLVIVGAAATSKGQSSARPAAPQRPKIRLT